MNAIVAATSPRRPSTPGALAAEVLAALHATAHWGGLYHILFGETDARLLPAVSRTCGSRTIATFHEPARVLEQWTINAEYLDRFDAVVLVSDEQRPHFRERYPESQTYVVPHGVDTRFFVPPASATTRDPRLCLVVGKHLRDHDLLARTITAAWQGDRRLRFVLIGVHGEMASRLRRPAGELLIMPRVSETELLGWYQRAGAVLLLFDELTASNSLLEALATGTAVVANSLPAVREYAGDAALAGASDPDLLADSLRSLLADPSRAADMGHAARARAEMLDHVHVGRRLASVYHTVGRADT